MLSASVGQEFGSSFAGWFWLRISPEVAVKMSAGPAVTSRLDWGWGSASKMVHSHDHGRSPGFVPGCWQEASDPLHKDFFCRASWVTLWQSSWFYTNQMIQERERQKTLCVLEPSLIRYQESSSSTVRTRWWGSSGATWRLGTTFIHGWAGVQH